jgi:ferric-dicitrate binding protein FerR (iron transport regulator)
MNHLLLLEKLAAGTATEAEKQQWQQWLQSADEATYRQLMQEWANSRALSTADLAADATVFNSITRELIARKALGTTMDAPLVRMRAARNRLRRYAVAAAALLALVTGTYLYYTITQHTRAIVTAARADKAPGGNRAILTLADGSKVFLDSSTSGNLSNQAGVQVVQAAPGSLTYQPADTSKPTAVWANNTLETPRGGQFQLTLPDGTKVWLNSASRIRYPAVLTSDKRVVFLTGEAYFEVAADQSKPFTVYTGNQKVTVLGTHFNINCYDDEEAARTTLLEGSVAVSRIREVAPVAQHKILLPGEQSVVAYHNWDPITVNKPDLAEVTAWKEGEFRFHNTKITTIMRQIARWYDVEVEYQGPVPSSEFYGVIPRKEYVSQLLKALALTKNVHFKTMGNKIIVMAGPG